MLALTAHYFHSAGLEVSVAPIPFLADLAARTTRIKFATLVLALPGWDPIRLAEEIAILDYLSRGRFIAGIGRGYQDRWVNVRGQHYGVIGAIADGSAKDRHNRAAFEEMYAIMKMAWTEDAISYQGKYYQIPAPYVEGIRDWPVANTWAARYGAPGEVDADGVLRKICVVPNPIPSRIRPYGRPSPAVTTPLNGVRAKTSYAGA